MKGERTLAILAILGVFLIISEGWLSQFKTWIEANVGFPTGTNTGTTLGSGGILSQPIGGGTTLVQSPRPTSIVNQGAPGSALGQ